MIKKKLKVAIFGGSFNPPHLAHQFIVNEALKKLDIDKLIIVPTYQNPLKEKTSTSANNRLKWCKEIFDDEKIEVSEYEIEHKILYTYETLEHFAKLYNIKYLIIGSDNLPNITKWRNFEWINDTITWIVFTRGKEDILLAPLKKYKIITMDMEISSTQIRATKDISHIDSKIKNSVKQELIKED